jgi:hypothetical protein
LNVIDSIASKHEGSQAREEREIRKRGDIVISEIDGILILVIDKSPAINEAGRIVSIIRAFESIRGASTDKVGF